MAIDGSYYSLYLLRTLRDMEDSRMNDDNYINDRADLAASTFESERRAGATVDQAQELAMHILLEDL